MCRIKVNLPLENCHTNCTCVQWRSFYIIWTMFQLKLSHTLVLQLFIVSTFSLSCVEPSEYTRVIAISRLCRNFSNTFFRSLSDILSTLHTLSEFDLNCNDLILYSTNQFIIMYITRYSVNLFGVFFGGGGWLTKCHKTFKNEENIKGFLFVQLILSDSKISNSICNICRKISAILGDGKWL